MKKSYEELKTMEARIGELKNTFTFLTSLFEQTPLTIKVEGSIFGNSCTVHMYAPVLPLSLTPIESKDDVKAILDFTEKRIANLEKEFNESK